MMTSPTGSPEPSPASGFATALLAALVREGVRDLVLSPGSRSQALAFAAARFEREGLLRLTVRIDERSAGFLALGLAVESRRPVAVVVTSGTAVANLHPAVLEAHHSGVPLVLLTADRPEELHGIGSNQTTHQAVLFGRAVRWAENVAAPDDAAVPDAAALAARAVAEATAARPGPVQLNLAFREPLSGGEPPLPPTLLDELAGVGAGSDTVAGSPLAASTAIPSIEPRARGEMVLAGAEEGSGIETADRAETMVVDAAPGTVVIAGHAAGAQAEQVARALDVPLLAEVSSGARFGPQLVTAYRELLDDPEFGGRVRRAIVFGHPTLSRQVPALLERESVQSIVVRSGGEDYNPGRRAQIVDRVEVQPRAVSEVSLEAAAGVSVAGVRSGKMPGVRPEAGTRPGETVAPGVRPEAASGAALGMAAERSWARRWVHQSRSIQQAFPVEEPGGVVPPEGGVEWSRREQAHFLREELKAGRQRVDRALLVDSVWRASWPHDRLVFGSSRLIREADRRVPGKKITVHANRGLAGIDGTIATAWGIAVASQGLGAVDVRPRVLGSEEPAGGAQTAAVASRKGNLGGLLPGTTRVLLGDLALLHDAGSLLAAFGELRPRMQLIVGNDGGGSIFEQLEAVATAPEQDFRRVLRTPVVADLAALAAAYDWDYLLAQTRAELERALTATPEKPLLIEVPLV